MTDNGSELGAEAMRALDEGRMADAAAHLRRIVDLMPGEAANWFNLGFALRGARDFDGALEAYARSTELETRCEGALVNRAVILKDDLGRIDDAERELRQALAIAPGFVPAWFNLGLLHEVMGRRGDAKAAYREAIAAEPLHAPSHARLAALEDDPQRGIAHVVNLLRRGRFTQEDATSLEFALANALDRAGRFDEAFTVATRANDRSASLRRPQFRYDPVAHEALVDRLIATFPDPAPRRARSHGPRAVFICGMFRSGSTVTERWLVRHPQIAAGGELEAIPVIVRERIKPYPEGVPALGRGELDALRAEYLNALARAAPGAAIVTDKRCDNFLHIGLIKTLFPDAVVVHTARDALDIAVSTYFLEFAEPMGYTTRLVDIAHYLTQYRRLMAHWEKVFGSDIVRVEYERLVSDASGELAPVFDRLGLEPADLADNMREDAIRTPSAWAARAPLNSRSVGRWRNYARYLGTVRAALDA